MKALRYAIALAVTLASSAAWAWEPLTPREASERCYTGDRNACAVVHEYEQNAGCCGRGTRRGGGAINCNAGAADLRVSRRRACGVGVANAQPRARKTVPSQPSVTS